MDLVISDPFDTSSRDEHDGLGVVVVMIMLMFVMLVMIVMF